MKALDNLIRLARWQLDEKRRTLAELERLRDGLAAELGRLAEELAEQGEATRQDALAQASFPPWLRAALQRRETLNRSMTEIDARIGAVRDEIGEAFREVKSYEAAAHNRLERTRAEVKRREAAQLDETGLNLFRRRQTA